MSVFPIDWHVQRLSELGFAYSGLTGKSKEDFGVGRNYVPYKNVFFNTFVDMGYVEQVSVLPYETQNKVQKGDVLLTISSETPEEVGMSSVVADEVTGELYLNSFCFGFRPTVEGLMTRYLGYAFRSAYMRRKLVFLAQGSTRFNISKGRVLEIGLPIPPLLEQRKIAAILTTMDDMLDVVTRQVEATLTLKQGLMQTLFSRGVGTQDANGHWLPHSEFKDSELGEIPATWVLTNLGSVCDGALQTGPFGSQLHADEYQDDGVPVLMPRDLVKCRATLTTAARISPARAEELSKHKLFVGDLLFSRRGDVARFALIDKESAGALCGTGCLKARPSSAHNSAFLAHLLQLDVVRAWLEQNAVGQTMPNMNTSILSSLPLVVPAGRQEQDEIARVLDSVDSKLQVLAAKQSHHQTLKRGLMQKLLTGEWRVSLDTSVAGT